MMAPRSWPIAVLAIAAGLAACGGGSGGSTSPVVLPTIPPATAPPTLSPSGSASFAGTKTISYAYGYAFGFPTPAPGATAPPSTLSYNVTANVSVGASPFPGPSVANILDEHIVENDASSLATASSTSDAWVALSAFPGAPSRLLLYGQNQQEPSSANLPNITTLYGTPQLLDEVPQTGAAWTNSPSATIAYSYADGNQGKRVIAPDGTFVDNEQMGDPTNGGGYATLTENSDASGSITGPYFGGGVVNAVTFSAPSPVPSASPNVNITIAFSPLAQAQFGLPATQVIQDPVWFATPLTFFSESDTITLGAALPTSCTPNTYGSTANDVRRKITILDTVVGDVETTQLDSFVANGLPICVVTSDVVTYAYDQQGNTPMFLFVGPLGLETVTTNESLILQPNAHGPLPASSAMKGTQSVAITNPVLAAVQAHQLSAFARERVTRERSRLEGLRTRMSVPAVVHVRGGVQ